MNRVQCILFCKRCILFIVTLLAAYVFGGMYAGDSEVQTVLSCENYEETVEKTAVDQRNRVAL